MSKRRGRQPTPKAPKPSLDADERGMAPTVVVDVEPIEVDMPQVVQVEMEPAPAPTDEWHVFSVPAGVPVQVVQPLTQDESKLEIILPTGQVVTQIGSDDPFDALPDSLDLDSVAEPKSYGEEYERVLAERSVAEPETEIERALVDALKTRIAALPDLPLPEGADERLTAAFDNASLTQPIEEMKEEYDFSDAERGKFLNALDPESHQIAQAVDQIINQAAQELAESSPDTTATVELDENTPMPTQAELLDHAIGEAMLLRSILDSISPLMLPLVAQLRPGQVVTNNVEGWQAAMQIICDAHTKMSHQIADATVFMADAERQVTEMSTALDVERGHIAEALKQAEDALNTFRAYEVRVADLDALTTSQVFEISDLRTERDTLKQRIIRLLMRMKDAKLYRLFTVTGRPAVVYAAAQSIDDVMRLALDAKIIDNAHDVASITLLKTDYLLG